MSPPAPKSASSKRSSASAIRASTAVKNRVIASSRCNPGTRLKTSFEQLNEEYHCLQPRFCVAAVFARELPLASYGLWDKAEARRKPGSARTKGLVVNQHIEKAGKANRAADAIAGSMAQTLLEMRPIVAHQFNIDEQLVTLAIAQAAMGIAASAASKATGMVAEECAELKDRLNAVVFDAMNELLTE
jgi:hypothetical protein